jgi:serine/threonine protein kinase
MLASVGTPAGFALSWRPLRVFRPMTAPDDASRQNGNTLLGAVVAGNFRIERLIGAGAMGNVYQAEQVSLGKAVAVKVLHPHLMSDEKLVLRFQREAKSASRLNHPNSIQIIDSGRDAAGTLYIAMELLTGRDLAQVIRDEFPLPIPRIVRIISQVLSALDEAHAHGVIHRDLKPSNIMLIERRGEPDFVKVCDYGIAKAPMDDGQGDAQMLTIQGLVCGTPEYMSPEQARGEPLDGRTDLYSTAVILYHMVTGDIPFRAGTPIGIVSRHLSEAPAVPSTRRPDPGIPPDLDDLILRGLAKSRDLRPASAEVFREELENIGTGRVGRKTLSSQKTVPATPAVIGMGPTTQIPVTVSGGRRARGGRSGRVLAIALSLGAMAAAAGAVVIRRSRIAVSSANLASTVVPAHQSVPPPSSSPVVGAVTPIPHAGAQPEPPTPEAAVPAEPAGKRVPVRVRVDDSARSPISAPDRASAIRRKQNDKRLVGTPAPVAKIDATTALADAAPHAPGARTETVAAPSDDRPIAVVAVRGLREIISEGEKLLSQGEVSEACRRGEDAKKAAPRQPAAYKFLGKCYMRAGDPAHAKENYRRYLELAPGAPDALFIESIVK